MAWTRTLKVNVMCLSLPWAVVHSTCLSCPLTKDHCLRFGQPREILTWAGKTLTTDWIRASSNSSEFHVFFGKVLRTAYYKFARNLDFGFRFWIKLILISLSQV
uniref:Secreted protein n=1 Tax=Cacopsylla melanoneura TaxID=428564 RepID=A0A8D8REZ1_9HEMI